jgi:transposase
MEEIVEEKQREIEEYKAETKRLLSQKEKEVQNWKKQLYEAVSATGIETKMETAKREWQEDQKKIFESIDSERKKYARIHQYFQSKLNDSEEKREKLQNKLEHRDAMLNKSDIRGKLVKIR